MSLVPLLLRQPELHTLPCNELNQIVITLLSGIHPSEGVLKVSTAASTEHGAGKAAAGENPENPAPCGDSDVLHSLLGVTPPKRCRYLFILSGAVSQTKS